MAEGGGGGGGGEEGEMAVGGEARAAVGATSSLRGAGSVACAAEEGAVPAGTGLGRAGATRLLPDFSLLNTLLILLTYLPRLMRRASNESCRAPDSPGVDMMAIGNGDDATAQVCTSREERGRAKCGRLCLLFFVLFVLFVSLFVLFCFVLFCFWFSFSCFDLDGPVDSQWAER